MAPAGSNPVVRLEDRIDYRPSGLDRVLTGEERSSDVGVLRHTSLLAIARVLAANQVVRLQIGLTRAHEAEEQLLRFRLLSCHLD
jgi:hypothetical protein